MIEDLWETDMSTTDRRTVVVIDADDLLFDDWPLVQIVCDEMRGGTDHFHAARKSPVIGFCADKSR